MWCYRRRETRPRGRRKAAASLTAASCSVSEESEQRQHPENNTAVLLFLHHRLIVIPPVTYSGPQVPSPFTFSHSSATGCVVLLLVWCGSGFRTISYGIPCKFCLHCIAGNRMAKSYFVGKKQPFCRKEKLITDTHCYRHRRRNNIFNNSFFF